MPLEKRRPDAPTRLAENYRYGLGSDLLLGGRVYSAQGGKLPSMNSGGCFETRVFYIETMNLFLTIDYQAKPKPDSWVMVKRLTEDEIFIEPYRGQRFIGVVRVLEHYRLPRPDQWNPRLTKACPG